MGGSGEGALPGSRSPTFLLTKWSSRRQLLRVYFLRFLGFIYFCAFASLFVQLDGLFGSNGLEPADVFLQKQYKALDGDNQSSLQLFSNMPTLAWFRPEALVLDQFHDLLCLFGVILSAVSMAGLISSPVFFLLWVSYLSLYQIGQTFLSFQWDILLLEVGFVAIFFAPLWGRGLNRSDRPPRCVVWLLRFVLFKLMLMAGAVKLQSRCPTWFNLTALEYHYATQCIPTPLAWYAHQLPPIVQKLSVAAALLIEGPATLFILSPVRSLRILGALLQVKLQLLILATGNYNFFNLLTIALALLLLDDAAITRVSKALKNAMGSCASSCVRMGQCVCRKGMDKMLQLGGVRPVECKAVELSKSEEVRPNSAGSREQEEEKEEQQQQKQQQHQQLPAKQYSTNASMGLLLSLCQSVVGYVRSLGLVNLVCATAGIIFLAFCSWNMFQVSVITPDSLQINLQRSGAENSLVIAILGRYNVSIAMSLEEMQSWVHSALPVALGAVLLFVFLSGSLDLYDHVKVSFRALRLGHGRVSCVLQLCWMLFVFVTALTTTVLNFVPITRLDRPVQYTLPNSLFPFYRQTNSFRLANGYGLFRSMTGVGDHGRGYHDNPLRPSTVARPEVILEGSLDGERWFPIEFRYKPSSELTQSPPWVWPHQPRLDWQMWFAALGSYSNNAWFLHLVQKILDGSSPEVNRLIDLGRTYPWNTRRKRGHPKQRPTFVRASLYNYDFTRYDTAWARLVPDAALVSAAEGVAEGQNGALSTMTATTTAATSTTTTSFQTVPRDHWWTRSRVKEYLPPIERGNLSLLQAIKSVGWEKSKDWKTSFERICGSKTAKIANAKSANTVSPLLCGLHKLAYKIRTVQYGTLALAAMVWALASFLLYAHQCRKVSQRTQFVPFLERSSSVSSSPSSSSTATPRGKRKSGIWGGGMALSTHSTVQKHKME